MKINHKDIQKLLELMDNFSLSDMKIVQGEESIQLSKKLDVSNILSSERETKKKLKKSNSIKFSNKEKQVSDIYSSINIIKSPMVGTFYRSSSPTAKPFIEVGSFIKIGQTIGIIEAMKTMNHIESDKSGIIKSILIEDSSPVEFDQPLIILE